MGKTSWRVNLSLYWSCLVSQGRRCTTLILARREQPSSNWQEHLAPAACTPTLPLSCPEWNQKMEKSPHSAVFPRVKPWRVTARWTDLPLISTSLLCTTSCAQDLPQHHPQQVRDGTTYHPSHVLVKEETSKRWGLKPLLRHHRLGRRAVHLRFGLVEHITLGL